MGRLKAEGNLPDAWHDTPDIHFCSIKDFVALCAKLDARVEAKTTVNAQGRRANLDNNITIANLFAEQAVFLFRR